MFKRAPAPHPGRRRSFPRYAHNLGGDEPMPTDSTPHVTTLEAFHDAVHPSAILVPVK
jgi:hypothetical protein